MNKFPLFLALLEHKRSWMLLGGMLLYGLGGGIAKYLGSSLNLTTYWLGQGCITFLQISCFYLKDYYDAPGQAPVDPALKDDPQSAAFPRAAFLLAGLTTLTLVAVFTVMLYNSARLNPTVVFVLVLAFLLEFFYAVPPLRLVYSGYGELSNAVLITCLAPTLAYLLQVGEWHRLLPMLTFPLTALYLSTALALSLEQYYEDMISNRTTLMVKVGWQKGMVLHNILILSAYLLMGIAASLGLPWHLTWPGLLSLPVGLFQIWLMIQISHGLKPQWKLLSFSALTTIGLTGYLIALTLWTG